MATNTRVTGEGGARRARRKPAPEREQILTVDEAIARYPNEWMLMQVTERDEHDYPLRGAIVAHFKTRKGIQKTLLRILPAAKETGKRYYFFFGSPWLQSPDEWRGALKRAAQSEDEEIWLAG